jgi:putative nucleotidyltransferase with HDIG domain
LYLFTFYFFIILLLYFSLSSLSFLLFYYFIFTNMLRTQALKLVREFVKNENLVKHMLAVEAAMGFYSKKFGEDEERWRVAGLLHDFDWEIHPTLAQHPQKGSALLRERGVDEDMVRTILSHADHTGVKREKLIDKVLFACDEITGLITTTALVRPSKKLADVELSSIKKKWKDKAFARGVDRNDVETGAAELGIELWDHVQNVLTAMKEISQELGL